MNLADALISKTYQDNQLILRQGEAGDEMYFVEEGTVEVTMDNAGETKLVSITKF